MYLPPCFSTSETAELYKLIAQYPLGSIVTLGSEGLDANHLPFELDIGRGGLGVLQAHVARNNPLWREVRADQEVLVIFRAGDAYISPQWYPSKQEHQKQVPTWNYRVVHAHGKIRVLDDVRSVRGIVAKLTRTHESIQDKPWKITDSPKAYMEEMLQRIVGIEIEITKLTGKLKLSQDDERRDAKNAGEVLIERGEKEIGSAMIRCAESD
jgi:transcriptional regulator